MICHIERSEISLFQHYAENLHFIQDDTRVTQKVFGIFVKLLDIYIWLKIKLYSCVTIAVTNRLNGRASALPAVLGTALSRG